MGLDLLIPIFANNEELDFNSELATELGHAGLRVGFVCTSKAGCERLRGNKHEDVFYAYDGFRRGAPVSDDEVYALERAYGIGSLRGFVYPEQIYDWGRGYDDLIPRAVHVFRKLEEIISATGLRGFFNNVGVEVVRRAIGVLAAKHGVPNVILDFAPFPNTYVLVDTELGIRLPSITGDFTASELAFARDFVATMRAARKPYAPVSPLGFQKSNFMGAWHAFKVRKDHVDVSLEKLAVERVRRVARRGAGQVLYERPDASERFVFFPLHLANDSAVTVRAPQFQRQEDLVAYVSERCLPSGTKLWVKPHIGARDAYPIEMMTRIARMPNVRLVEPTLNPHDLIERAIFTLVINSTAGFEAIVHGKPVVVVGRPFYRGHGVTVDVDSLIDLPSDVERALAFRPDAERVEKLIALFRRESLVGTYGDRDSANVRGIAQEVARVARERFATSRTPTS